MNAVLLADLRSHAQGRIRDRMFNKAEETNHHLMLLANQILKAPGCHGIKVLGGPIKDKGDTTRGATFKVNKDYGGDWYELKDVVRMTLVARNETELQCARAAIEKICRASNGMGVIKNSTTTADKDPCGYSGLNLVVRLKNGYLGEIQVNFPEILYVKMSEASFRRNLGDNEYLRIKTLYGIEGGLGHLLYEVYRVAPLSDNGKYAALLSKDYYAFFRGAPQHMFAHSLRLRLTEFKQRFGKHV